MLEKNSKIYIAGSKGMVGSAIKRHLEQAGFTNVIGSSSKNLNLIDQSAVNDFFAREKPEAVILSAGKVGGILANNTYRAEFIYDNLMIEANVIHASYQNNVGKLIFLGSSCIYPKFAEQPIKEEMLLTGFLEPTNEPYAVAKIAGIKLCENYFRQYGCNFYALMPTNLYGTNDNFDLKNCHVIPALIRRIHEAKIAGSPNVTLWGTGSPRREFMYVDDLAEAVNFFLCNINADDLGKEGISHLNVGIGKDIEIREIARIIKNIVGFEGEIEFDPSMPDGIPRKMLDVGRLNRLGWKYSTELDEGLRKTYQWFLKISD